MQYVVAVIVCLGLLCSSPSFGQQPAHFEAHDKTEIEQLLDRYAEAFVSKDYTKLRATIQAPFVRLPGNWDVLRTVDDVMAWYRQQREALDKENFEPRAKFLDSRMTVLGADRALVNKTFRRYRKDGSLLAEMAVFYVVSKSSGAWKLSGILTQDWEYFGKVY